VGWRHKAYAEARRAIAYPPKHKQIDSSTLYASCFWWVGYFDVQAGRDILTPIHPKLSFLYVKVFS
jgi:hypothetical protein